MVKNLPANAGDSGSIPESRRSPGEGNGHPLQYCLEKFHGQRNMVGYSPWGLKRVGHNLVTKQQQMYGSSPLLGTGDLSVNNTSVIMKLMV